MDHVRPANLVPALQSLTAGVQPEYDNEIIESGEMIGSLDSEHSEHSEHSERVRKHWEHEGQRTGMTESRGAS
jgi:hypothetical protein